MSDQKTRWPWLLAGLLATTVAAADTAPWRTMGRVAEPRLAEASGLAASRRHPNLLWTHNDSGNAPVLYGLGADGHLRERVELQVAAGDWEDIEAFEWRDQPYLAIADTGDNLAWRTTVQILLLPEPAAGARTATVERVLRLRYPQGPRDVEAIAIDPGGRHILLLEKRVPPAALYAVDLDGPDEQTARRIGTLPAARGPGAPAWASRDLPTAMTLDARRGDLLVMTYLRVLRYRAAVAGDWPAALAQGHVASVPLPRDRRLYEALAVDTEGAWWAIAEGAQAPLLRRAPAAPP